MAVNLSDEEITDLSQSQNLMSDPDYAPLADSYSDDSPSLSEGTCSQVCCMCHS